MIKENEICKDCGHTKKEHEFYETGHCSHYKEKKGGFIVWCKCEKFVAKE